MPLKLQLKRRDIGAVLFFNIFFRVLCYRTCLVQFVFNSTYLYCAVNSVMSPGAGNTSFQLISVKQALDPWADGIVMGT